MAYNYSCRRTSCTNNRQRECIQLLVSEQLKELFLAQQLDAQTFVGSAWKRTLTTLRFMELVTGVVPRSDVRCQVILIEAS